MSELKIERRDGGQLRINGDTFRVEEGPVLATATATKELLDNRNTAAHYQLGGPDAYGYPIEEGKPFQYLDHGGSEANANRHFYIYQRIEVDASAEKLADGSPNPYFVPEDMRDQPEGDGPANRTHFDYVFVEVGTAPTEEDALEKVKSLASRAKAAKPNAFPKSHLEHLERALSSPRVNWRKRGYVDPADAANEA